MMQKGKWSNRFPHSLILSAASEGDVLFWVGSFIADILHTISGIIACSEQDIKGMYSFVQNMHQKQILPTALI